MIPMHNNFIAFKMNFNQEYLSEIEISDSDETTISKGTTEVTLKDGFKCQNFCD